MKRGVTDQKIIMYQAKNLARRKEISVGEALAKIRQKKTKTKTANRLRSKNTTGWRSNTSIMTGLINVTSGRDWSKVK